MFPLIEVSGSARERGQQHVRRRERASSARSRPTRACSPTAASPGRARSASAQAIATSSAIWTRHFWPRSKASPRAPAAASMKSSRSTRAPKFCRRVTRAMRIRTAAASPPPTREAACPTGANAPPSRSSPRRAPPGRPCWRRIGTGSARSAPRWCCCAYTADGASCLTLTEAACSRRSVSTVAASASASTSCAQPTTAAMPACRCTCCCARCSSATA